MTTIQPKRQRPDGTWTYATPEHDAKWYWPVGTRVQLTGDIRPASLLGQYGIVTKQNSVTVVLRLDDGRIGKAPMKVLARIQS